MSSKTSIEARVAAKEGVYDQIAPEIDPHGDPIFKVAFETPEGVKIFEVTSEEYYRLEVGMQGLLTYDKNEIVSFGKWIRPFRI
ncbi:MAG: hypothetical protein HUJ54_02970 [Erysipelotrichaceae bacterium]|nr:hypothetical protein [Erysipelotrichaceae bacterium]